MSHTHRNPLIVLVALAAATAAPLAFAQDAAKTDAATTQQSATQATTEAATATDATAAASAQQSTDATAASGAKKQGWEEVDTDKDGNISKTEAGVNAGLAQVFDKADTDTDGKLTPQEYKDFVAKNYGQKPQATP